MQSALFFLLKGNRCLTKKTSKAINHSNGFFPLFYNQIAELKRGAEIIVCTPGRMIDMLAANNGE